MDSVGNPYLYPHRAEFIPFILVYATAQGTDKVKANYFNLHDVDNVQVWVSTDKNNVRIELAGTPNNKETQIYVFVPEI